MQALPPPLDAPAGEHRCVAFLLAAPQPRRFPELFWQQWWPDSKAKGCRSSFPAKQVAPSEQGAPWLAQLCFQSQS